MASTNLMGSLKAYWRTWLWRDMTTRIITVNTIVWIVIGAGLLFIPASHHQWWIGIFGMPASIIQIPSRIWTPATYMISQYDFLHLLVNMIWLLLFGRLMQMVSNDGHLLGCYVLSGLAGAATFVIGSAILGSPGIIIGASCAVIGVIGAVLVLLPHFRVNLLLFGPVKIIWIAVAAIVLFVFTQPQLSTSIAHAGGLACGVAYAFWLKRSDEIAASSIPRNQKQQWRPDRREGHPLPNPAPIIRPKRHEQPKPIDRAEIESQLDVLLDKVNRSGYSSLTPDERQRLFDLSQQLK